MRHLGLRDDKRGRECDPRARDAYQDISECFAHSLVPRWRPPPLETSTFINLPGGEKAIRSAWNPGPLSER
jgi:hypothetical protein